MLDVPFRTAFIRLIRRTVGRVRTGETLWGTDNRETLGRTLLSKDSILWWQLTTFRPKRRAYPGLLSDPAISHVVSHRLRSASEVEAFLEAADSD